MAAAESGVGDFDVDPFTVSFTALLARPILKIFQRPIHFVHTQQLLNYFTGFGLKIEVG